MIEQKFHQSIFKFYIPLWTVCTDLHFIFIVPSDSVCLRMTKCLCYCMHLITMVWKNTY